MNTTKSLSLCVTVAAVATTLSIVARRAIKAAREDDERIDASLTDMEHVAAYQKVKGGLTCFQLKWITSGKAQFPFLKFTEANFMMVADWLSREMKAMDVRPDWIAECLPIIVVGIITPSRREIKARRVLKHAKVQAAVTDMQAASTIGWFDWIRGVQLPSDD